VVQGSQITGSLATRARPNPQVEADALKRAAQLERWPAEFLKGMKKRLRKKLRLGEFREFGFEISFRLSDDLDQPGLDGFWDSFIGEAIEARGLMCGGACGCAWDVFVTRTGRHSATEEDRRGLTGWLERHPNVSDVRIGPLIDAWHSA
jgi:uncharacterized protein YggL (DUF469 family)